MQNRFDVRLPSVFLKLFTLFVLIACTDGNQQEKAVEPLQKQESAPIKKKKKAKPRFPKPEPGKVKPFFLSYGEKHTETLVLLRTRLGDIKIRLYDETPVHRANFIYNIKQDLYHQTIFYRVVPNFMIQGGNSDYDQTIKKRERAGSYYLPNEAKPGLIHKRGSIAMAMSYKDNPKLKSAQYSYYIVIGERFSDEGLEAVEEEYNITIPEKDRAIYRSVGGTPHLDGVHTVFGEVVEGMDVVEAISNEKRDSGDWPINDVVIECEVLE